MRKLLLVLFIFMAFSLISVNGYAVDNITSCNNITNTVNNTYINASTNFLDLGICNINKAAGGILIINASNITIDCNMTEIKGNYTGDYPYVTDNSIYQSPSFGVGINVSNFSNVTIKNCIISNYSHGIYYNNSENNTITNNTIHFTAAGVSLNYTNDSTVLENTIYWGGRGILIGTDVADWSFGSLNNTIVNNTIYSMKNIGMYLWHTDDNNTISNNTIYFSYFGMLQEYSNNTSIVDNTIHSNEWGIIISSSYNVTLTNNNMYNNTENIRAGEATYTIINTTISDVEISTTGGVNVTIGNATSPPADPSGLYNISKYLNLTNESTEDTWIYFNISYTDSDITGFNETTLKIYHYNDSTSTWENITEPNVSEDNNYVHGNISNFSYVGVFGDKPPTRSGGSPSGTITTSSATLSLTTNEQATCRYSTSSINYYSMGSETTAGTSHSWSLTSLGDGTYTYYVRCKDLANNINTDDYSISFTVSISSTGPGGGGGVPTGETETISEIEAGESAVIEFTEEAISEIELTVINSVSNVVLSVRKISLPSNLSEPEHIVYRYLQLSKSNLKDEDIESVKIKFKVEKSWITNSSIDSDKVYLMRWIDDKWNKLLTSKINETSEEISYQAESAGLSYFAIVGYELAEAEGEISEELEEIEKAEFEWTAASIAIVIILIIIGLGWYIYSKKKKK